jgi:hypothetical protein
VDGYDNLLLLCPSCHNLIDELEPDEWTVERLEQIKFAHERRAEDPGRWATDEQLARFVAMAIAAAVAATSGDGFRMEGTGEVGPPPPNLVLRQERSGSSTRLRIVNEGGADALSPNVQPIDGSEGAIVLGAVAPATIPPQGEWTAGQHSPTFGDSGPHALKLSWTDSAGTPYSVTFPVG